MRLSSAAVDLFPGAMGAAWKNTGTRGCVFVRQVMGSMGSGGGTFLHLGWRSFALAVGHARLFLSLPGPADFSAICSSHWVLSRIEAMISCPGEEYNLPNMLS